MHFIWRFTRPMTLGVRAVCLNAEGEVFLVKHSYVKGWHLPGGGVEAGETMHEALVKELREEGNIILYKPQPLFAVYLNKKASKRDHVLLYMVREFTQEALPKPNMEIIACGWFALDALPEGTTDATHTRLQEALRGQNPSPIW